MPINQEQTLSFKTAWLKLHKKQLPIILGIAGFELLLNIIIHISLSMEVFHFEMVERIILTDLVMLPLAGMNSVFLVKRLAAKSIHSGWKMIALKIPAAVIGVMLMSTTLEHIYASFGFVDDDYMVLGELKISPLWTNVVEYSGLALIISLPIFIWQLRIEELSFRLKEKEMEQERLTQLKVKAELHALQSRINPHFLFNSFNSIASLISTDPEKAEKMTVQLSELFRYSLNSQESNFVTIKEELKIVETYLGIEKVRFAENLEFHIDVPEEIKSDLIPRFLIQPLVENAIKHATSKIKKGKISLKLSRGKTGLKMFLFDNGSAFPEPMVFGYGLQSTLDKLNLLYPEKHAIQFINQPKKHIYIRLEEIKKYA